MRRGTPLTRLRLFRCLLALGLGGVLCRAEPAAPTTDPSVAALAKRAAAAEKNGLTNEAVFAYTQLLERDISLVSVVGARLVELEIARNEPAAALRWAVRVARRHPQPDAYLSGVYARLGQWKESELLLRKALADERAPDRRVPLLWQLADAQERQGELEAARLTLARAVDEAGSAALKTTARQRLASHRQRQDGTNTQAAAAAEGTP